jgi:hypothetical protein
MLELLVFAPCEKIIIDDDDKLTSMIVLMEAVDIRKPDDFPPDAVVPMSWNILCLWHRPREVEAEIRYEQRIDLLRPDGEVVGNSEVSFVVGNKFRNFRNKVRMNGFPVGVEGECRIKLFLREAGESIEWREMATYPIVVRHKEKEATSGEPETAEV